MYQCFYLAVQIKKHGSLLNRKMRKIKVLILKNLITQVRKLPLPFQMNTLDVQSLVVLKSNDFLNNLNC